MGVKCPPVCDRLKVYAPKCVEGMFSKICLQSCGKLLSRSSWPGPRSGGCLAECGPLNGAEIHLANEGAPEANDPIIPLACSPPTA
jgi:hypothetical protein